MASHKKAILRASDDFFFTLLQTISFLILATFVF